MSVLLALLAQAGCTLFGTVSHDVTWDKDRHGGFIPGGVYVLTDDAFLFTPHGGDVCLVPVGWISLTEKDTPHSQNNPIDLGLLPPSAEKYLEDRARYPNASLVSAGTHVQCTRVEIREKFEHSEWVVLGRVVDGPNAGTLAMLHVHSDSFSDPHAFVPVLPRHLQLVQAEP